MFCAVGMKWEKPLFTFVLLNQKWPWVVVKDRTSNSVLSPRKGRQPAWPLCLVAFSFLFFLQAKILIKVSVSYLASIVLKCPWASSSSTVLYLTSDPSMWENTKANLPTGNDKTSWFYLFFAVFYYHAHDEQSTHCGLIKYSMYIDGVSRWRLCCIVVSGSRVLRS